jgi:protease-4
MKILSILAKVWIAVTSVIGSLLVLGLIALVVLSSTAAGEEVRFPTRTVRSGGTDKVAIIPLSGQIVSDAQSSDPFAFSSGMISSRKVTSILDHAREQDDIKAVVLLINSPGGAVVASDDIYIKVRQLREKKPVIVSFGDVAASGGYYIASGATEIIANPASITGSIGVIAQFPQYDELLGKVGVQMRTFKSGEFKDIGSPERPFTDSENQIVQRMIDEAYVQFVQAVASGRNMDFERVRQLADGRIYTGIQAKENGLIDELGNLDTAINHAMTRANVSNPTIIEFTEGGFFETLFSSSADKINPLSSFSAVLPQTHTGVFYLMSF